MVLFLNQSLHTDMSLSNIVKEKYGEVESETKISSEQILSKIQEFGNLGKSIYKSGDLKETSKTLSDTICLKFTL